MLLSIPVLCAAKFKSYNLALTENMLDIFRFFEKFLS